MTTPEERKVPLPTYETTLVEAIRSLAVDSGIVTSPAGLGGNSLSDSTKSWAANIHRNRLVKVIRGTGADQIGIIQSNSNDSLVVKQPWLKSISPGAVYVILGIDLTAVFGTGEGRAYTNSSTAVNDDPRRFENTPRRLAWAVIIVETNAQLFGTAAAQMFPLNAAGSMGSGKVDLSTLYFRNRVAGSNGTVYILGVEE